MASMSEVSEFPLALPIFFLSTRYLPPSPSLGWLPPCYRDWTEAVPIRAVGLVCGCDIRRARPEYEGGDSTRVTWSTYDTCVELPSAYHALVATSTGLAYLFLSGAAAKARPAYITLVVRYEFSRRVPSLLALYVWPAEELTSGQDL